MEKAVQDFLNHLKYDKGGSENTVSAYGTDLRQFRRELVRSAGGAIHPEDITGEHLKGFVDWVNRQGYKSSTVARKIAAVRSFLSYLAREHRLSGRDWLDHLPTPLTQQRAPRILSKSEVDTLLAAPETDGSPRSVRDAALLSLLFATGMRAAEVVDLDLGDVDLLRGRVSLPDGVEKWLPLGVASDPVRRYVRQARPHFARDPRQRSLFLNQQGKGLSRQGVWLVVKRWAKRSGLGSDVTPQTLRHSLAQDLLRQGRSRREVQSILGLSSSNAIRVYVDRMRRSEAE